MPTGTLATIDSRQLQHLVIRLVRRAPLVPMPSLGRQLVRERLQNIDAEVRAHEHPHINAGAAGRLSYDYVTGPDGQSYAAGGSVSVDLTPVPGDPEATLRKAKAALSAAYAPIDPSAADLAVAARAYQLEMQAKRELAEKQEAGRVDLSA